MHQRADPCLRCGVAAAAARTHPLESRRSQGLARATGAAAGSASKLLPSARCSLMRLATCVPASLMKSDAAAICYA
jgi:hypothetical protein